MRAWLSKKDALWLAISVGWIYIILFGIDLAHVFPPNPEMPVPLGIIEVIVIILAAYVIVCSHKALERAML